MNDVAITNEELKLKALNQRIGESERNRDTTFLTGILADDLVFRRASGARVGKREYLDGIVNPANRYDSLKSDDIEVVRYGDGIALVSLRVRASGTRSDTTFEGVYRNTRVFLKDGVDWRCIIWFNTPEG